MKEWDEIKCAKEIKSFSVFIQANKEFECGSEWTLVVGVTHASRTIHWEMKSGERVSKSL